MVDLNQSTFALLVDDVVKAKVFFAFWK